MILFFSVLGAILIALYLVHRMHAARVDAVRREQQASFARRFAPDQLALKQDDAESFDLTGATFGEKIHLDPKTLLQWPGTSSKRRISSKTSFEAPLPDLLVARNDLLGLRIFPFPGVAPARTGHSGFDAAYSIFVAPSLPPGQAAHREDPRARVALFSRREVLEGFLSVRPAFLLVKGRQCDLVGAEDEVLRVPESLELCVNIHRAARGAPALVKRPSTPSEPLVLAVPAFWVLSLLTPLAGATIGAALLVIPPLRRGLREVVVANGVDWITPELLWLLVAGVLALALFVLVPVLRWSRPTPPGGAGRG